MSFPSRTFTIKAPRPPKPDYRMPRGFNYTAKGTPCATKEERFYQGKSQLTFRDGVPYIRLCHDRNQKGQLVPVRSAAEAAKVSRDFYQGRYKPRPGLTVGRAGLGRGGRGTPTGRKGMAQPFYHSGARGLGRGRGLRLFGLRQPPIKLGRFSKEPLSLGRTSGRWPVCRKIGKLTAAKKNALPDSAFGLPEERSFPMPDPSHAKNAKARAKQSLKRKQLSKAQYERVVRKADRVIAMCKGRSTRKRPRRKR